MRRALLSVYDKTGVAAFAEELRRLDFELLASGGTARLLADEGIPVIPLEELTGFAEMLGHRVVTLHPAVHGGILARRDVPEDVADLAAHGIEPIDLVCVNLYPFERTVARLDVEWDEAIEQIDVGGPALLRAAAKNHADVIPVCRPDDYERVLAELRDGGVSVATRRELATRAFTTTASYDSAVARWFSHGTGFPETFVPVYDHALDLSYGENPHQRAVYYAERGARTHLLARVEQLHGKALSFNNLNDLSAARLLALELDGPACVIVKHANPSGVGVADTIEEAYDKALAADPTSAFGGVVVVTRPVSAALGERLAEQFVEVLFAPGYDAVAVEVLVQKPGTRILNDLERRGFDSSEWDVKRVLGGLLVQDRDGEPDPLDEMDVVCGEVAATMWDDLLFAWTVVKHTLSNAIVIARGGQTLGIGAGQMSRVDAVRIAVEKAREHGHSLEGAALASDAFFPFADGPAIALEAGVQAIIQPGGSKRDERDRRGGAGGRRRDGLRRTASLPALTSGGSRPWVTSTCRHAARWLWFTCRRETSVSSGRSIRSPHSSSSSEARASWLDGRARRRGALVYGCRLCTVVVDALVPCRRTSSLESDRACLAFSGEREPSLWRAPRRCSRRRRPRGREHRDDRERLHESRRAEPRASREQPAGGFLSSRLHALCEHRAVRHVRGCDLLVRHRSRRLRAEHRGAGGRRRRRRRRFDVGSIVPRRARPGRASSRCQRPSPGGGRPSRSRGLLGLRLRERPAGRK